MDLTNEHLLKSSPAKFKLLLDANVVSYAMKAEKAIGLNLLNFIDGTKDVVDWFIAGSVAASLANNKVTPGIVTKILNCSALPVKMDLFPYRKPDGTVVAIKLNKLAGDDFAQVLLATQHEDLIIVTNDSAMFKSAHAILDGRAITFHELLKQMSPLWFPNKDWIELKNWFFANIKPLRNNSSWNLPVQ